LTASVNVQLSRLSRCHCQCDATCLWEAPRIHGELLKLGIEVAESTVAMYMVKPPRLVAGLPERLQELLLLWVFDLVRRDFPRPPTAAPFILVLDPYDWDRSCRPDLLPA
jgi:hypothetical protein